MLLRTRALLSFLFATACAFTSPGSGSGSVHLDLDGGYHVTVGIAEDVDVLGLGRGQQEYVDNVKAALEDFSTALWKATDGSFHMKSAQILVPREWATSGALEASNAVTASYSTVDIQVSASPLGGPPRVDNFYPCGKAGSQIHLPSEFIAEADSEEYGPKGKALLNLWLRYRFGVWEEHGYPNHALTPYFYQPNALETASAAWRVTSCNDSQLHGEVRLVNMREVERKVEGSPPDQDPDGACNLEGRIMDPSCRFYPHEDQDEHGHEHANYANTSASTSVMNFPWVTSISGLCNNRTHGKYAPNRQNLYCGNKSVWEVIQSSEDFQILNHSHIPAQQPGIQFQVVSESQRPFLYILLDTGSPTILVKHSMYEKVWLVELARLITEIDPGVIGKFVTYPLRSAGEIMEEVGWSALDSKGKAEFKKALDFRDSSDAFMYDFRLALAESIGELKERAHPSGAVLLVLRVEDVFLSTLNTAAYEEEFILELKTYGIKLFEVQVQRLPATVENARLEYLATESGGSGVLFGIQREGEDGDVRLEAEASRNLSMIVDNVLAALNDEVNSLKEYSLIFKGPLGPLPDHRLLIPKRYDVEHLHIYVTSTLSKIANIHFGLPVDADEKVGGGDDSDFEYREQWRLLNLGHMYSKTVDVSALELEPHEKGDDSLAWAWELYVRVGESTAEEPEGSILIYGSNVQGAPRLSPTPAITGEIFTSAESGKYFGCESSQVNEEPLSIYVRLALEDGTPVFLDKGGSSQEPPKLQVQVVSLGTRSGMYTAALWDGGFGPDLTAGDGIYSAYIYPTEVGLHRIYVSFYDSEESGPQQIQRNLYPDSALMSKTQDRLEATTVNGTRIRTPYAMFAVAPVNLQVTQACGVKRYISKVRDVQTAVTANDTEIVHLSFTVPPLVTSMSALDTWLEPEEPEDFGYFMGMIRMVEDLESLLEDPEQVPKEVIMVQVSAFGTTHEVFVRRNGSRFVTLELLDFRQPPTKSGPSNIAAIKGWIPPPPLPPQDDDEKALLVGCDSTCILWISVGCGLGMALLVAISLVLWKRNRSQDAKIRMLSRREVREFRFGVGAGSVPKSEKAPPSIDSDSDLSSSTDFIQSLPYDARYEIPISKLHIDRTELLGAGMFGAVFKGYVLNLPRVGAGAGGKVLVVAVKTMKPDVDKTLFKALLAEVKLMTYIGSSHPNILRLVGACTKSIRTCQVFMATEFCPNGNLLSYLQKAGHGSNLQLRPLLKWSRETACGMEFLGQKRIVHGDLAARNILLDGNLVAKIGDFGLSKQLCVYAKYSVGAAGSLLPWKWLAPETLQFMKFSVASDVWAYGVTLWEIFSLGQVPYPGVSWSPDFVHQLEKDGRRLPQPRHATGGVYRVMCECWNLDPGSRPGFQELKAALDRMMTTACPGSDYMQLEGPGGYQNVPNFPPQADSDSYVFV